MTLSHTTITNNGKPVLVFSTPEDAQFWFKLMRQEAAVEGAKTKEGLL